LDAPLVGASSFFVLFNENMKVLDLHGTRHEKVKNLVQEFVLLNETPLKIITGKSTFMKSIVKEVLEDYGLFYFPEHYSNFGAYIIQDKTKI
jgi:hypothetical protein